MQVLKRNICIKHKTQTNNGFDGSSDSTTTHGEPMNQCVKASSSDKTSAKVADNEISVSHSSNKNSQQQQWDINTTNNHH